MTTRLQWWAEANRAIGSVPLVVYVPTRDQVDIQSRYADIAGGFPIANFVQTRLQLICSVVGCQFYDLTLPFIDAEKSGIQLYFKDDPHWNSNGVHHAATLIADYIKENVIGKIK